jgi:hypothetical protein
MPHAAMTMAVLAFSAACNAYAAAEQPLPSATGRDMAAQVIDLVEKHGLPPVNRERYEERRRSVLDLVGETGETIDRDQLYGRLRRMLDTLDTDNHTFIASATQPAPDAGLLLAKRPERAGLAGLIDTPAGKVLRLTPPRITVQDEEGIRAYVSGNLRQMADSGLAGQACALVVDLGEQTGGNAWPPMDLLQPLFSESNDARFVDRYGNRSPVFSVPQLAARHARFGGAIANPLHRFAGQPVAFVMGSRTASAGEMIAIALMGEGQRTRSFGWPSLGLTTANQSYRLPDNAMLVLSTSRYGLGNGPVIRGRLQPQVAADDADSMDDVLQKAAAWSAGQSGLCKGPTASG